MTHRGPLRAAVGVALVAAVHAHLVSSSPADDDALEEAPRELRLVFNEPVEAALSRVVVVSAAGEMEVRMRADSTDVRVLVGALPALPVAEYRVDWRTVSADGHPVDGTLRFTVVGPPAGPTDSLRPAPAPAPEGDHAAGHGHSGPSAPAGVSAVLRGLALFALLVLAGWLVQWIAEGTATPGAWRTAVALAAAASVLLAAHFAAWLWHVTPAGDAPDLAAAALRTGPGRVEAVRVSLALLALWALGLARRPWLGLTFAVVAVLVSGAAGHSAGIAPRWSIPLKSLHLLALAVWMGGVAWLAVASVARESFGASASRVSGLALGAVAVVGLTGLAQSALFLPGLDAVTGSAYGRLVLAKAAGLAGLVAFGAWNRGRLMPRLAAGGDPGALRASTRRELALMLAVSVVAGVLAYVPPPPA